MTHSLIGRGLLVVSHLTQREKNLYVDHWTSLFPYRVSENKVLVDLLKYYIDPKEGDPIVRQRYVSISSVLAGL